MNPLLKTILIVVISSGISILLLNQIYKSNPKIFSFAENIPEGWKGKWYIRWAIQLFLIIIVAMIFIYGGLNQSVGNVIVGFIIALVDFVFSKSKRQSASIKKRGEI